MKKILFFIIPILSMTTLNAADINDNDIETMVETLLSKMTLERKSASVMHNQSSQVREYRV